MWFLLILCVPYICALETSLAPFITKCKLEDANEINTCLKESAQKAIPIFVDGLPNLNVETLDPLKIKQVNATKPGLEIIVNDIVVTGLKNCKVLELNRVVAAEKLFLKLECTVHAEGLYDMNGQILFIAMKGHGPMIADINRIHISVDVSYKTVEVAGEQHWKIKTWQYSYLLVGKSKIVFENLFPGNEVLRKSTTDLIANHGNEVIVEMGTPLIKAVVVKIVKNIDRFFEFVSLKNLVLY